jgi:hypothetical protein
MTKALMIATTAQITQKRKAPLIFGTLVRTYQGMAISSARRKANQAQAQADLVILSTSPGGYLTAILSQRDISVTFLVQRDNPP